MAEARTKDETMATATHNLSTCDTCVLQLDRYLSDRDNRYHAQLSSAWDNVYQFLPTTITARQIHDMASAIRAKQRKAAEAADKAEMIAMAKQIRAEIANPSVKRFAPSGKKITQYRLTINGEKQLYTKQDLQQWCKMNDGHQMLRRACLYAIVRDCGERR